MPEIARLSSLGYPLINPHARALTHRLGPGALGFVRVSVRVRSDADRRPFGAIGRGRLGTVGEVDVDTTRSWVVGMGRCWAGRCLLGLPDTALALPAPV